jgi:glutathione S-transferase
VPGLVLDDGTILSEGIAVHTAIDAAAPSAGLLGGPPGSSDRLKALEYFSFIGTDIHAGSLGPFYSALVANPENKEFFTKKLQSKFAFIASTYLAGGKKSFFEGKVTSPDLYLAWSIEAAKGHGVDVGPEMEAFLKNTYSVPAVKAAIDEANAAFA